MYWKYFFIYSITFISFLFVKPLHFFIVIIFFPFYIIWFAWYFFFESVKLFGEDTQDINLILLANKFLNLQQESYDHFGDPENVRLMLFEELTTNKISLFNENPFSLSNNKNYFIASGENKQNLYLLNLLRNEYTVDDNYIKSFINEEKKKYKHELTENENTYTKEF